MVEGFTLVELVLVVVVLAIVSLSISSRYLSGSNFDQRIARDGAISVMRQVQQSALGKSNVSLKIETSGSSVVFSEVISGATGTTSSFPANEVAITAGSVGSGTTCGSISSTITLNFDSAGEIEAVDDDGFPICLNGESSLCISPAGFAHDGACL